MPELRIYVNGEKRFAPFDLEKFKGVVNNWPDGDETSIINALLEHAISEATGNVADGDPYTYAKLELLARSENGSIMDCRLPPVWRMA